jgi:hypothetical protein
MKVRKASRSKNPTSTPIASRTNTYSLSTAKTYLGRLADKAKNGEPVYIMRGSERFILQVVPEIEPIPMRPPGYFKYDKEDIELFNEFAKASVIPDLKSE